MAEVTAEPDDSRSIGHARIVITGLAQPPTDGGFRIIREGYPAPNLGRRGWQVGEERLQPIAVTAEAGRVVLIVGPAVTVHLQVEPYQFSIPAAGIVAALFWPDTINVFDGELPDAAAMPADDPPPAPVSKPAPKPAADFEETRLHHPVDPPPPPPPAPAPVPDPNGGSKLPLILGAALVLLLVGGGGGWWYMNRPVPPPTEPVPTSSQTPAPGPTAEPIPPPVRTAVWPDGTDALSPGDVVARAPDQAGIHAVALRRQQEGKHDDALVLFEEAAERGHGPAMTAVARMYDPNGFVPGRPFRNPDRRAAAKYYRDAVRAGDTAAEAPRAALRTTLEAQAASGNANAETYLRDFWP